MAAASPLFEVRDLVTSFDTGGGRVVAVDGLSYAVSAGETLGVVGESGSGKSVTQLSVLGLLPTPPAKVERGTAMFDGQDLLKMKPRQLRALRGNRVAMIFQDPMTSLNPFLRVRTQLTEVLATHTRLNRAQRLSRAVEMLERVGIPDAGNRVHAYPHEFSGGMRQRVMIAMALLCDPELLIADEPTTALDVTIQAQILELLASLRAEKGTGIVLITHDLGVVAGVADRIMVMYAGRAMELAPTSDLFARTAHPYTAGLLQSLPRLDGDDAPLVPIPGQPPVLTDARRGCPFAPRCAAATDLCRSTDAPEVDLGAGHTVWCHHPLVGGADVA